MSIYFTVFGLFIPFVLFFGIPLLVLYLILKFLEKNRTKQIKPIDKNYYFRDIPCFKNTNVVYWLLYYFSDYKKEQLNNGLIGAYLLKWYRNGYIDITISDKALVKNDYVIDLKNEQWPKDELENCLYNLLKKVAGNNNLLEKNEIKNYCSVDSNYIGFKVFFDKVLESVQNELESNNYITTIPSKDYIFFKTPPKFTLSDALINEYKNLIGLKQFLLDMSLIDEKKAIEVHLWEDYLIFANVLGIADKVREQFKKIYQNNNIVGLMFAPAIDDDFYGPINVLYKQFRWQTYLMIGLFVMTVLIFIGVPAKLFALFLLVGFIYFFYKITLGKYFVNKKVKEMDKIMYAKITNIAVISREKYDRDTKSMVTDYDNFVDYEYSIDGNIYKGSGRYDKLVFAPKVGETVKIYYNEQHPENSELAQEHNEGLRMFKIILGIIFIPLLLIFLVSVFK